MTTAVNAKDERDWLWGVYWETFDGSDPVIPTFTTEVAARELLREWTRHDSPVVRNPRLVRRRIGPWEGVEE